MFVFFKEVTTFFLTSIFSSKASIVHIICWVRVKNLFVLIDLFIYATLVGGMFFIFIVDFVCKLFCHLHDILNMMATLSIPVVTFILHQNVALWLHPWLKTNNASKWVNEQVNVSRKESRKIFHATSWNIPKIFVCHMELICDVAKYSMFCHEILCHLTCVICSRINNDLLTLNISSFMVQPMIQVSKAFIQYLQYFLNCWNDEKMHA